MRDKEYNRYHRQEYNVLAPEDTKPAPEIYDEGAREHVIHQDEMFDLAGEHYEWEETPDLKMEKSETSGIARYRKTILRKMVYMVAAAAMVVTMGQTLDLPAVSPPDQGLSEEERVALLEDFRDWWESIRPSEPVRETDPVWETEWITQEYVEQPTAETPVYRVSVGADISQYDGRGYTAGGVMPVNQNGLWGLIGYDGQILLAPTYPEFVSSPNDRGYTVFGDGNRGHIYNANGQLVYTSPEETDYLMIGEDNIIMVCQSNYDGDVRYFYQHLDGRMIFDTGWQTPDNDPFTSAVPFHDGRAYVCAPDGSGYNVLYEVTASGAVEIDRDRDIVYEPEVDPDSGSVIGGNNGGGGGVYVASRPVGAYSQGYFLGNYPAEYGYSVYHPDSGKKFGNSYGVSESMLQAYGVNGVDMSYLTYQPNSYKTNGVYAYNYGPYGVITFYDGQTEKNVKDFLVDLTQVDPSSDHYSHIIAAYDGINLDDFRYLAAMDNGQCFYIDYAGNIVSDYYDSATTFTDRGYAMVLEGTTAHVINDRFEKMKAIEGVGAVGYCGDCFTVYYLDGRIELFYYVEE